MPPSLPRDPVSKHYSKNLPGANTPTPRHEADKHATSILKKSTSQEVDRIEAKYWHNRFISFCKNKINRIIHPPPSIKTRDLVDDLTERSPKKDVQRVLAALKLHMGKAIKLHQSDDGKLGYTNRKTPVSTETLEAVVNSIKQNGVEMAYEYLRKGVTLPAGYLQNILIPHIHQAIRRAIRYEKKSKITLSQEQVEGRKEYLAEPEKYIKDLLKKSDIKDEKDFTFERLLELKKTIRSSIVKSIDEQNFLTHILTHRKTSPTDKAIKQDRNSIDTPKLEVPGNTDHFIEREDRKHIQKLSSEKSFFTKTHISDIKNRIKRTFLRNKITHIFFTGGIISSIVITAIFPPAGLPLGIAITLSVIIDAAYEFFWSSGTNLWRRVRLIRGLRQIKKYADFDFTNYGPETDEKRKNLIKNLRYQCNHKTFTQIYNAYAELEKQAEKLQNLAEKDQKTVTDSIAFQKEKFLYDERRKKLESNLFFFDKLIEQITISRMVIEQRNQKELELLWNEKFAEMNPITRDVIFKKAAKNLVVQGYQVKAGGKGWLSKILRHTPLRQFHGTADNSQDPALEKAKISKLFTSLGTLKSLTQAATFRSIKKTIFNNLIVIGKIITRRSSIIIHNPIASKPDLAGSMVFVSFFFLEMATGAANTKINQSRINEIKNKEQGYTRQLIGKRKRTGREEVATLRSQAKQEIEPMIDHLLASIKSMEKTGKALDDAKQRSKMLGKGRFGAMNNEYAARMLLKHAAWKKLLDSEINGTFSLFYRHIQEKASDWNSQIGKTLVASSKKASYISAVSDNQIHNHITDSGQR